MSPRFLAAVAGRPRRASLERLWRACGPRRFALWRDLLRFTRLMASLA